MRQTGAGSPRATRLGVHGWRADTIVLVHVISAVIAVFVIAAIIVIVIAIAIIAAAVVSRALALQPSLAKGRREHQANDRGTTEDIPSWYAV